jgi:hypothetical protein
VNEASNLSDSRSRGHIASGVRDATGPNEAMWVQVEEHWKPILEPERKHLRRVAEIFQKRSVRAR